MRAMQLALALIAAAWVLSSCQTDPAARFADGKYGPGGMYESRGP